MKKGMQKKRRRVIIIAIFSIAIVAVIVYLIVILQSQNIRSQSFIDSYESLVSKAHILTQSYQNEVGKWQAKKYDNKTMISITNDYLPKYEGLVNESMTLNPSTKQYQNAEDPIVATNPKWEQLITAIRGATAQQEYKYDKDSPYADIFDAWRVAMKWFRITK